MSFGLAQLANRAINSLGGFYLHAIPARSQISPWATVPAQVRTLGQNLMYLFGSNFWVRPQALADFAYLHLIGLAVALIGLLIALWGWPRADRVTRTLVVGLFALFAASAVSPLMQPVSGAHEIAIMVPFGARPGRPRHRGPWLAPPAGAEGPGGGGVRARGGRDRLPVQSRLQRRSAVTPGGEPGAGRLARRAPPDQRYRRLLGRGRHRARQRRQGHVAPVVDAAGYGYPWESKAAWFDPKGRPANFIIAHVQHLGAGYLSVGLAKDRYGKPAREYFLGQTVVLVYDRNVLKSVIQPTPADLYGPSAG